MPNSTTLDVKIRQDLARIRAQSFLGFLQSSPLYRSRLENFIEQHTMEADLAIQELFGSPYSPDLNQMNREVATNVFKETQDLKVILEMIYAHTYAAFQPPRVIETLKRADMDRLNFSKADVGEQERVNDVYGQLLLLSNKQNEYVTDVVRLARNRTKTLALDETNRNRLIRGHWQDAEHYSSFLVIERDVVLRWEDLQVRPSINGDTSQSYHYVSYLALMRALDLRPLFEQWAKREANNVFKPEKPIIYLH